MTTQILKHVQINDLIKITVFNPDIYRPGIISVDILALEKDKRVVIDSDALRTFNNIITQKCQEFEDARDPKVKEYIKEFTEKMCIEWHRNGLMIIEDVPDALDDPYQEIRKKYKGI